MWWGMQQVKHLREMREISKNLIHIRNFDFLSVIFKFPWIVAPFESPSIHYPVPFNNQFKVTQNKMCQFLMNEFKKIHE